MSYVSILFLTALLVVLATGIIVLVLIYQKKQLQYLNEKDQMKARFDKEILESRLEIQEQTMKHISQEVHDNIGQVLSVVKLNINLMNSNSPKPLLQERIDDTAMLVGKVIQDLRSLSKSLHSDIVAEIGLVKAIEHEFALLKKTGAYATGLVVDGEPYYLPDQKELILFRIFQEAMNNIIKHAQATQVEVRMGFYPDELHLWIQDNGQGFVTDEVAAGNGIGLRNIKNRSHLIGATCQIESRPGSGTLVTIELPVGSPQVM